MFGISESKASEASSSKKLKKSKHKKSKNQGFDDESTGDLIIAEENIPKNKVTSQQLTKTMSIPSTSGTTTSKKARKKRDSASSDEERWLTAIESGKLEDVDDELKKIKPKDPALMTARQRAMYDRGSDNNPFVSPALMSLPTGYKVIDLTLSDNLHFFYNIHSCCRKKL